MKKKTAPASKKAKAKTATPKRAKRIYFFGGGKAEMTNIGAPVPPGFTITTEVCTEFYATGRKLPKGLEDEVRASVAKMETLLGTKFGDPKNPLLVSVRSGARASMPGMMDTILNLGLNDETAKGWPRFPTTSALPTTATAASSPCMAT